MTLDRTTDPTGLQTRAELGTALTALRESNGLTVRDLARQVGAPPATVGGYLSGRHLPSPAQLPLFKAMLAACGVTDPDTVEQWVQALGRARTPQPVVHQRGPSPYPGLHAFGQADAARFFGRDEDVRRVLDRLRGDGRPVAVLGPSGSGKSSLLRAGVAAAVAAGELDDPATGVRWACAVLTPGSAPHQALDAALAGLSEQHHRLLVVDQFEEVFTAVADADVRERFLRRLLALAPRVQLVLGLRADFYAVAAREPLLLPILQDGQVLVGPMTVEQLREVIVRPARDAGADVHEDLVDRLLSDLTPRDAAQAHDAGALPLLSHALMVTWISSTGERLTVADYRSTGGIQAAVQRTADACFERLTPVEQQLARRIFLRLIHVDDVAVTRRRAELSELSELAADGADPAAVLGAFVDARLLTAGARSVEVSHEALLTAWPRLRNWVDADRSGLRLQRQITEAAGGWKQAGHDPSLLLAGGRLEAALDRLTDGGHVDDLAPGERAFLDASVARRDAERRLTRRRTQRLRALLAGVAVLAVVAAGLAALALHSRTRAAAAERTATAARDDALSRQVAIESAQLAATNPALAQQLALVAYRIAPTSEARSAVIDASAAPLVTRVRGSFGYAPLALSPRRTLAAVGQADTGRVLLLDLSRTATVVATLAPARLPDSITGVAFSPDGSRLYAVGTNGRLDIWDVSDPRSPTRRSSTTLTGLSPRALAVTPDGEQVVVAGSGARPVRRLSVSGTPTELPALRGVPAGLQVQALAISADGARLAAAGRRSQVYAWSLGRPGTAPLVATVHGNFVFSLIFAGTRLFAGDSNGEITALAAATMKPVRVLHGPTNSWVQAMALSPDGRTLGAGTTDNLLRQYSVSSLALLSSRRNPSQVTGVGYLPSGLGVLLTCGDGNTYRLPERGASLPVTPSTFSLMYDRSGARLLSATNGGSGGFQLWDARRAIPTRLTPVIPMRGGAHDADGTGAISPDGASAAVGNAGGQVQLFDLRNVRAVRPWGRPFAAAGDVVESVAFSPDGRYLAVGADDHTVSVWNVADRRAPRLTARLRGGDIFYSVAWSPDGRLLAGADVDSHVYLWQVSKTARPVLRARLGGFVQEVWSVAFSRDGRRLAATGSDRTTRLWDVSDPRRPRRVGPILEGATDYALAAAFNDDGTLLAVSSNDHDVRLYDLRSRSRTPLVTLSAVGASVFALAFSPDGRTLVAGGRSGTVAVWTTDPAVYARALCSSTGAVISRSEWTQYVSGAAYAPPCR